MTYCNGKDEKGVKYKLNEFFGSELIKFYILFFIFLFLIFFFFADPDPGKNLNPDPDSGPGSRSYKNVKGLGIARSWVRILEANLLQTTADRDPKH